jgi:hypothetical protein
LCVRAIPHPDTTTYTHAHTRILTRTHTFVRAHRYLATTALLFYKVVSLSISADTMPCNISLYGHSCLAVLHALTPSLLFCLSLHLFLIVSLFSSSPPLPLPDRICRTKYL